MAGFASSSLIELFKSDAPLLPRDIVSAVEAEPSLATEVDPETGNTALHYACCMAAPLPVVEALLGANKAAAGAEDADGNIPLMGAVANGCPAAVVKAVLRAHPAGARARFSSVGAPPPKPPSQRAAPAGDTRHTLLHAAACHGASAETVAALIAAWPGAAREVDGEGNTPLHFAAACQAPVAVVRALIDANPAAATMRGRFNRLPLALALLCEAPPDAVYAIMEANRDAMREITISADFRNHGRGVALPLEQPPSEKGATA